MALKLSIFTTATNPEARGDLWSQSLQCYTDLADELIVVDGTGELPYDIYDDDFERILCKWPQEFNWPFIGEQFQRGYEACTGDVAIHADLDFIFHENDYQSIRDACEQMVASDAPALTFYKYQFIQPDKYGIKSRLVLAVNKAKYSDRIRFDSGGDGCQPSLDGEYITPDSVPEARVGFWNYEKICKTKEQAMDDVGRMDRAYQRHFGKFLYSEDGTDGSALDGWLKMVTGRYTKPQKSVSLKEHPAVMINTIRNLKPSQFGYNGFGELK